MERQGVGMGREMPGDMDSVAFSKESGSGNGNANGRLMGAGEVEMRDVDTDAVVQIEGGDDVGEEVGKRSQLRMGAIIVALFVSLHVLLARVGSIGDNPIYTSKKE